MLYHGTSLKEWKSIQKEGLIPAKGRGGDAWAAESPNALLMRAFVGLPNHDRPEVFLAKDPAFARHFASFAAEVNHSKPVILAVDISPDGLEPDPEVPADENIAYVYPGVIPPEKIKVYEEPKTRKAGA